MGKNGPQNPYIILLLSYYAENRTVAGEQLTLDMLKMQIHSILTDVIS